MCGHICTENLGTRKILAKNKVSFEFKFRQTIPPLVVLHSSPTRSFQPFMRYHPHPSQYIFTLKHQDQMGTRSTVMGGDGNAKRLKQPTGTGM